MSDDPTAIETWIGVISLLPDGEKLALAWVRRRDEWLADAATAERGAEIDKLARMYIDAVAKRDGRAPTRLNLRAAVHADALSRVLDTDIPIDIGFDTRAQELSDAAASAIDLTFGAEALVSAEQAQRSQLHERMHGAVETQIEQNDPPETAATLARLRDEGMDRDGAIHMIAAVLMRRMHDVLVTGVPFDVDAYVVALGELTARV
jgi:hypothetical protein